MTGHRQPRPGPADGTPLTPAILVAAVASFIEADKAIAAGADMIDGSALSGRAVAAIRARHPGARLWAGSPAVTDAEGESVAAVVATAAVLAWLGTPAIRTRHVLPVRRAIDMTCSIAGTRLPALTTRGLA
jgi:hypothetical protein